MPNAGVNAPLPLINDPLGKRYYAVGWMDGRTDGVRMRTQ